MLPVHAELAESAIEKINNNIYRMIDLFLSSCEGLDYETFFEEIFPPFYLRNNVVGRKDIIVELMEMTQDSFKRDYLKPIFEYVLFMLIHWWIEVTDDEELPEIIEPEELCSDEVDLIDFFNNVDRYKDFLFDDWDFLDIPIYFERYKENPLLFEDIFHMDLYEYIDLMPNDIKKEYLLLRAESDIVGKKEILTDDEDYIIKSIYNQIQLFSMHAQFFSKINCSENALSDLIHDALKLVFMEKGLYIEREVRAGYSKVETGELDFYINKYFDGTYKQIAVGENKEWGRFEDSLKQLIGYMNEYTQFGFTIIYNKTTQMDTIINSRLNILKNFNVNQEFAVVGEPEKVENLENVLKTTHQNPEHEGTYFRLYHFIFNVYRPERELSAKEARRK